MLHYIIQTVAFQLFFLIIYDAILRKETFFNWNRAYLFGTAILSVTLPFVKIESFKNVVPEAFILNLPEVIIGDVSEIAANQSIEIVAAETSKFQFSWELVLYVGASIALVIFLMKLIKIGLLIYRNPKYWNQNLRIVTLLKSNKAFSFFYYVFLGEGIKPGDKPAVLRHEAVHVNQKHTLDLLFFEVLRILFWFNPLVYMYQNRISVLHEFIADAEAIKLYNKHQYYQDLLSQIFQTENVSFINAFYKKSLIKKRIIMLSKSKSKQILKLKYALLIPMVLGMLVYTSCTQEATDSKETVDLKAYSYAMKMGEPMSDEIKVVHEKYEAFLLANPQYVSWNQRDGDYHTYSIHHVEEAIPSNLSKSGVQFPNGSSYVMYVQWPKKEKLDQGSKEISFSIIDEVPTFTDCSDLSSNDERRKCMSTKITKFVQQKFNVDLAGDLGLEGKQRISVIFKIDTNGDVIEIHSRAASPKLEEEAKRVIGLLPKMSPGKHNGEHVIVPYSLPIIFQVKNGAEKKTGTDTTEKSEDYVIERQNLLGLTEVPFSVVDQLPMLPACEFITDRQKQEKCISNEVAKSILGNFNTDMATNLGLKGKQRIHAIFKISKEGRVFDIRVRAPHPDLEAETIRTVKLLPKFTPGKHKGEKVNVSYSLPIVFKVNN